MESDETKISLYLNNKRGKKGWKIKRNNLWFSLVFHNLLKTTTKEPAGFIPSGKEDICVQIYMKSTMKSLTYVCYPQRFFIQVIKTTVIIFKRNNAAIIKLLFKMKNGRFHIIECI